MTANESECARMTATDGDGPANVNPTFRPGPPLRQRGTGDRLAGVLTEQGLVCWQPS